ncbi:hypothetical protein L3X38_005413 [Prunus dulcis]|uniref:Disease resistance protein TIR-NBS-LRR class family n=1 Tax=Prunus dulcis TaxID=3755 RepID=A0AAD4ZQM1_PRUDU|nr:hypothetical protein L3X38_005413 [Prunus dulcis]
MATGDDNETVSSSPGVFRLRWDRPSLPRRRRLEPRGRDRPESAGSDRGLDGFHRDPVAEICRVKMVSEELAKICERRSRLILPVFYQVDPSHVRHQNEPFAKH